MSATTDAATLAARFVNNTSRHVFLTGKAGTGKTTFLRYITQHTHKQAVIAAPTGVAAINAGGVTLHSLFQLPFGAYVPVRQPGGSGNVPFNDKDSLIRGLRIVGNKRRLLQELELLIIDEVSMLRADLLDAINTVLQTVRRNSRVPFGGVQVLFIGDLLQLPPVVKEQEWQVLKQYYRSPFFFDAQCLQGEHRPLYLELQKVYRQQDDTFISVLNHLRHNQLLPQDVALLNKHYQPNFRPTPEDPYIQLTTHNHKADTVNREALQRLPGKSHFYKADIDKDFPETMFPLEETLELKPDAQVMLIKNDFSGEKRFYNGKIGKVSALDEDGFEVSFEGEPNPVRVERHEWHNIRYRYNDTTNHVDEEVLGTFSHFPVRLAWAITIHKSQGLTFQKAILDLGKAFAPGQVYVALSRLTSLDGLVLCSPIPNALPEQDQAVADFADSNPAKPLTEVLQTEQVHYLRHSLRSFFDFSAAAARLRELLESYGSEEHRTARQHHLPWAQELAAAFHKEQDVAAKFQQQLDRLTQQQPLPLDQLEARVQSASGYFEPALKALSRTVLAHLEEVQQEKRTRQYQTDLLETEAHFFRLQQQIAKAAALLKSLREGTELTREAYAGDVKEREALLGQTKSAQKQKRQEAKAAKELGAKKEVGQTQAESFKLFQEGHSIEEISKLRSLAVTTIEGHLARYVTSGDLPATQFVDPIKLEQIITVAKTLESEQLSAIKAALGDEFTYTDIRFAVAELKRREM